MANLINQELPSVKELAQLSPYAMAAYATRCALRVLPLVNDNYSSAIVANNLMMFCSLLSIKSNGYSSTVMTTVEAVAKSETTSQYILDTVKATMASADKAPNSDAEDVSLKEYTLTVNADDDASIQQYASADDAATATANAVASTLNAINSEMNFAVEIQQIVDEARSDFDDLKEIQVGANDLVNKDFYSKPLWVNLNESKVSKIEKLVSKWISAIQSESNPLVTIRYWNFFDSTKHGEIPWDNIEREIILWLGEIVTKKSVENQNEEPAGKSLNLNADGAPTSLGSGMSDTDLLGRQNLINSLVAMIASSKQDTPFTIGLLGDWGSGKSNVMYLLRKALGDRDDKKRFYFANFNAWEYEHTENMAAGVAQEVFKGFLTEKTLYQNFKLRLKFGKKENGVLLPIILLTVIAVAIFSLVMIFAYDNQGWYAGLGVSTIIIGGFIKQIFTILEHPLTSKVNSYLKLPSYAVHLGTIPMLKGHLQTLCDIVIPHDDENPNRLIVFVDDLDRCDPQAISKTLNAIRLIMDIENVVVIIGIDHRIAFRAVEKQYVDLADDERTSADIARDYLGKIIQLPVILNKPGENELENFISNSLFKDVKDLSETENQKKSIERTENSKSDAGPDITYKNDKGKNTISVDQTRTDKGEGGSDKSRANKVYQEKGSVKFFALEGKPKDQTGDMAETEAEKQYFTDLCKLFGMHNPRKLIRLRNCYRLLKRIYRPSEDQWKLQMLMLFWLEFLFELKQKDRDKIENCLTENSTNSLEGCIKDTKIMDVQPQQIAQIVFDQYELEGGNFEIYSKIEQQVKRFVLPHSESAKRAKKEEQPETKKMNGEEREEQEDSKGKPEHDDK